MRQIPSVATCPICDGSKIASGWLVESNSDGALTDEYWVHVCQECGAGITFPRPAPETLAGYYQSGVYQKSGARAFWLIDPLLMAIHDQRLREIRRLRCPPGTLLDMGCGKGRFVARAAHHGWNAQGVDSSPGQVAAARARYSVEVFEGELQQAGFADNTFDLVTAWHVLEHIPDPHALIAEVQRVLRPGGLFVCEVPNFASWQVRLGRSNWFHLDVPRHLIHFTPTALEYLLSRHNLRVVSLRTFSLEVGPFGMLQSILNRIGLPPNMLYRWLRRSDSDCSRGMFVLNMMATIVAAGPSLLFEITASAVRAGGVVRVVARRDKGQ